MDEILILHDTDTLSTMYLKIEKIIGYSKLNGSCGCYKIYIEGSTTIHCTLSEEDADALEKSLLWGRNPNVRVFQG